MLEFAREGDTIYVVDFLRLARSTKGLLDFVELLKLKGVQLVSIKENIDTSAATGRIMFKMISAINDFGRENMLDGHREGIAIAKAEGKYKGRKEVTIPDFNKHYKRYMTREVSKSQLVKERRVSRPTLDEFNQGETTSKIIRDSPRGLFLFASNMGAYFPPFYEGHCEDTTYVPSFTCHRKF